MDQKLPGLTRIYKQLLEFWRQLTLLGSILLKNAELLKELLERCSLSSRSTWVSEKGWEGNNSHDHLLTSGSSDPKNRCLKIGHLLCHFFDTSVYAWRFLEIPKQKHLEVIFFSTHLIRVWACCCFFCFVLNLFYFQFFYWNVADSQYCINFRHTT